MLAARAARTVDVHLDVFRLDLDLDVVVDSRQRLHQGEGGVAPGRCIERADAHQAVDPALRLEVAVGPGAAHLDGDGLDAGLFPFQPVGDFAGVAVALDPAQVHAHEHLRPILRLGPADPGVDRQDGVAAVVGAAQRQVKFERLVALAQPVRVGGDLGDHRLVIRLGRHRQQLARIGHLAAQHVPGVHLLAQRGQVAHHRFSRLRVGPDVRAGGLLFEPGDLRFLAG